MQSTHDPIERGAAAIGLIVLVSLALWGVVPLSRPDQRTILVVTATPALEVVRAPAGPKIEPTATPTPAPTSTPEPQPTQAPELDQPAAEAAPVVYAAEQAAPATPVVPTPEPDFYDTSTLPTPGAWLVEACASPAGQKSWICGAPAAPTTAPLVVHFVNPDGSEAYSYTCKPYGDWRDSSGVYRHPECEGK